MLIVYANRLSDPASYFKRVLWQDSETHLRHVRMTHEFQRAKISSLILRYERDHLNPSLASDPKSLNYCIHSHRMPNLKASISPNSTKNMPDALLFSENQENLLWGAIFKSDEWIDKAFKLGASPVLVGPELDKIGTPSYI